MDEFTIKELVDMYAELTESMIRNYRNDSKFDESVAELGTKIDGELYFRQDEVDIMLSKSVKRKIMMKQIMFEFLKLHPGIIDKQLDKFMYKYCNNKEEEIVWTKERTDNILADLSDEDATKEHTALFEKEDASLYVLGYEKRKRTKSKKSGIFYDEV